MSDDYNIMGLDPEGAREYVVAVMTTLKAATAKRLQLEKDLELWESRVKLAAEKGRADLAEAAEARAGELRGKIAQLDTERKGYQEGIAEMMAQLKQLRTRQAASVDADLLLAQMQMLVGETAETDQRFREAQAQWALDELKKKMGGE